jgi:hypothetical protein
MTGKRFLDKAGKNFLQVFQTPSGRLSSKRIAGFTGWCVVLWVLIHCTLSHVEAPVITEVICIVSASLLGIGIFDKRIKAKAENEREAPPEDAGDL